MLPELKVLLASLAAEGVLARLAGSLPRNPLSLVVRRPPVQLCTQVGGSAAEAGPCSPGPALCAAIAACADPRKSRAPGSARAHTPVEPRAVRGQAGDRPNACGLLPAAQATLAAAQRRYRHVQANGGTVRLPWRAAIQLPPQLRTNSPRSVFVAPSGSFGTPAQARRWLPRLHACCAGGRGQGMCVCVCVMVCVCVWGEGGGGGGRQGGSASGLPASPASPLLLSAHSRPSGAGRPAAARSADPDCLRMDRPPASP